MDLVALRRDFVAARDRGRRDAQQPAQRGPPPQRVDPFIEQQREMGRKRRKKEERRRSATQEWFVSNFVHRGVSTIQVEVPLAPHYAVNPQRRCALVTLPPLRDGGSWKPRASALLFAMPYGRLLQRTVRALREGCADESAPLAALASDGDDPSRFDPATVASAAHSLQRMFTYIYHGHSQLNGDSRQRRRAAPHGTGGGEAPSRTAGERLADEQQQLGRVLDRLSLHPYLFPDVVHGDARRAILDTYAAARIACPERASMVTLLAMRVACVLFAMAPHLVPLAQDATMADILTRRADEIWQQRHPALLKSIWHNARCGKPEVASG